MLKLPSRRLLALSVLLVVTGAALILLDTIGTFNTPQTVPDYPGHPLYTDPVTWPGFVGTALAVAGLAMLAAGFAGTRPARRGAEPKPVSRPSYRQNEADHVPEEKIGGPEGDGGPSSRKQDAVLR
ncbi:MAG: hypothetical protein KGJ23_08980 [Euryarchaeota archaeon]|nr:hypothetical protein [Euryarchaeota archaeon]MDE1836737.1 hypothetical protein [Euryarchaeota archaeon]MDE1879755.1 hypothetical protein [Euryarchaeota archaeon]MDE2044721.1 hypothetical protein [Thermoplasmata archaeon]